MASVFVARAVVSTRDWPAASSRRTTQPYQCVRRKFRQELLSWGGTRSNRGSGCWVHRGGAPKKNRARLAKRAAKRAVGIR